VSEVDVTQLAVMQENGPMVAVGDRFCPAKLIPEIVSENPAVGAVLTVVEKVTTGASYEKVRVVEPITVASSAVT